MRLVSRAEIAFPASLAIHSSRRCNVEHGQALVFFSRARRASGGQSCNGRDLSSGCAAYPKICLAGMAVSAGISERGSRMLKLPSVTLIPWALTSCQQLSG